MAMIVCPHCGEQVSEKAKQCVYCGALLIAEEKKHCMECGAELEEGVKDCPNCGCPVDDASDKNSEEKPQQVEVTGVRVTRKIKVIIVVVIAFLLICTATLFGVKRYQNTIAAEKYTQRAEEYAYNLSAATNAMLTGASDAESCGNLIENVWRNAIYEIEDDETDAYTRPEGKFVSDFNDALSNLFEDIIFSSKISSIETNQDTVNGLMKKLQNPPDEYKGAYDAISEFYDAYISLTNCATNPSGNLMTYTSTFNDADTNIVNAYKALEVYFEE